MSDFSTIGSGVLSPFVHSRGVINAGLQLLKRGNQRSGDVPSPDDILPPACRIWIRNDTGADLDVYDVVKIGDALHDITDDLLMHQMRSEPIFKGEEPAASTDAFAILTEPAAAVTPSGHYSYARAVVSGVVPVDVNVTNAAHTHATPTAADATKLTSAASGPAIILYKPSGTGTKRCVVQLTGQSEVTVDAPWTNGSAVGTITISSNDTWTNAGSPDLILPSAGSYLIRYQVSALAKVSALSDGNTYLAARIFDVTNATEVPSAAAQSTMVVVDCQVVNHGVVGSKMIVCPYAVTGATNLRLEGIRRAGPTWTTAQIGGTIGSYAVTIGMACKLSNSTTL